MRGNFFPGSPKESCSDFGSSRGFAPYVSCNSFPLLPISSAPPPLFNSSSPSSSGFGGISPSSYQVSFTGGNFPCMPILSAGGRDGNSYTVIVALGYEARLNGVEMVSILDGYPRFNAHIEGSIRCAPI